MSKTLTLHPLDTGHAQVHDSDQMGKGSVAILRALRTVHGTVGLRLDLDAIADEIDGDIGFATHEFAVHRTRAKQPTHVEVIVPSYKLLGGHALHSEILANKGLGHGLHSTIGAFPSEAQILRRIRAVATNTHALWLRCNELKSLFDKGSLLGHCDIRHQPVPSPCSCVGYLIDHESDTGFADHWIFGLRHPGVHSAHSAAIHAEKGSLNALQLEDQYHWRWATGSVENGDLPTVEHLVQGIHKYWQSLKTEVAQSIVSEHSDAGTSKEHRLGQ